MIFSTEKGSRIKKGRMPLPLRTWWTGAWI